MMQHAFFGMWSSCLSGLVAGHEWKTGAGMVAEAALRSAVMGAVVYGVLKVLKVRQVRAQRYAWSLALLAALAMPALARLPQPAFRLTGVGTPARISGTTAARTGLSGSSLLASSLSASGDSAQPVAGLRYSRAHATLGEAEPVAGQSRVAGLRTDSMATARQGLGGQIRLLVERLKRWPAGVVRMGAAVYFAVAGVFLLRLAMGVALTWQVREHSVRAPFSRHEDIRLSGRMKTPVTIGTTIVLPEDALEWDAERLRVVLAHERAHVQQRDSLFLLLANLHCALFWFSPFSWWLQRRLCALGEAMADLAAVGVAESRTTYAQVLLEFARAGHQPAGAVAMARASNLRPRIERLLNDRAFHESVGECRRLMYVAAGIVPLAMLASASLVRVHAQAVLRPTHAGMAAARVAVAATPARTAVISPAGSSYPAARIAAASTALSAAMRDALVGETLPAPGGEVAVLAMPQTAPAPAAPAAPEASAEAPTAPEAPIAAPESAPATATSSGSAHGSHSTWDRNGDSTTLVTGDGQLNFSGPYNERYREIRRKVQGDFFLYQHDGKDYVIQDKTFLDEARALYRPMEELGKQQEALGKQQEALGRQQEALGKKQSAVSVPTPDMSKELAELTAATAKLKDLQAGKTIDRQSLAELQGKIGDIQGRLGELQGLAGEQQGKLGEEQGRLGEQQGKLGEEQGKLGRRQGELGRQAQEKLKPMIDEAMKNGTAKQID